MVKKYGKWRLSKNWHFYKKSSCPRKRASRKACKYWISAYAGMTTKDLIMRKWDFEIGSYQMEDRQ